MKSLLENLISKKNISKIVNNKFGITERDLVGKLEGFPLGIVIRMLEETELQGNDPDVRVFQQDPIASLSYGGFSWALTNDKHCFWNVVLYEKDFDLFYEKYPEYKKYDKK